jgi:hypothetical protein
MGNNLEGYAVSLFRARLYLCVPMGVGTCEAGMRGRPLNSKLELTHMES